MKKLVAEIQEEKDQQRLIQLVKELNKLLEPPKERGEKNHPSSNIRAGEV
jgi:hypothetical protein